MKNRPFRRRSTVTSKSAPTFYPFLTLFLYHTMHSKTCQSAAFTAIRCTQHHISRHSQIFPSSRSLVRRRSDETSLDDLMFDVENLLSDLPKHSRDRGSEWRTIDWNTAAAPAATSFPLESFTLAKRQDLRPTPCGTLPSPIEKVLIRDRLVYIKRDDLLRLKGSNVSGNKARKMYALNEISAQEFPECIVSYGGPQSNAMLALAAIVHSKNAELGTVPSVDIVESPMVDEIEQLDGSDEDETKFEGRNEIRAMEDASSETQEITSSRPTTSNVRRKRFVYYTKTLPRFLRDQPNGNLFRAQTLGMEIVEVSHDEYSRLFGTECGGRPEAPPDLEPPVPGDSLWVPQGGASGVALAGGQMLAQEIASFWAVNGNGRPLTVCVPGGTCSTALVLHREIRRILQSGNGDDLDIKIVVIPCVGDDAYARRQMIALNSATGGNNVPNDIPTVLLPSPDTEYTGPSRRRQMGYFTFAEPAPEILCTFCELEEEYGLTVDLLYGAPSWNLLLQHWRTEGKSSRFDDKNPLMGREIMYVHSGGLEGINSQMTRYRYKGLVGLEDIQLPTKRIKSK